MTSTKSPINRFRSEIRNIIAEIEAYILVGHGDDDREFELQRRAFRERCGQAEQLTGQLDTADAGAGQWSLRDGDAHRIHESLRLSLEYFSRDQEQ